MKKCKALAENLRFVVGLDPQSLFRVEGTETCLQLAQNICIHGVSSGEIGSIFFCSGVILTTAPVIPKASIFITACEPTYRGDMVRPCAVGHLCRGYFRAQPMPDGIAPRPAFALLGAGTGAPDGVASVGLS